VAIAAFPPPPAAPAPHSNFSLKNPSLMAVGRFAHRSVGNSAHRPWGNRLFQKPVSERVKPLHSSYSKSCGWPEFEHSNCLMPYRYSLYLKDFALKALIKKTKITPGTTINVSSIH
jgi:hypothetical protein